MNSLICLGYQGWHRLEKYLNRVPLNMEGYLKKFLKIKFELKSEWKINTLRP